MTLQRPRCLYSENPELINQQPSLLYNTVETPHICSKSVIIVKGSLCRVLSSCQPQIDPSNTSEYLSILTVNELCTLCHDMLKSPHPMASQKSKIIHVIKVTGIEELQTAVFEAAKIKYDREFSKVQSHRKRR